MKINYRQLSVLVFLSFIALKFFGLPSVMYMDAENMSWLVTLVLVLIDGIYTLWILSLMKKNQSKNFMEFLSDIMGPIFSRIVLIVLLVKYALLSGHIVKGLDLFVVENLYAKLNWYVYILPLMALVGFMIYKGIRNIGRVSELIVWPIIIGCIYIALKALSGVEWIEFLPFFKDGVAPLLKCSYNYISWFGSSVFLFVLFGYVDFDTERKSTMIKYIFIALVLILLLHIVFYGLFGIVSPTHGYCISDVGQFSAERSLVDELTWLVVSLWIVAQAVQLALYAFCMSKTIQFIFNIEKPIFSVLIVIGFLFAWAIIGERIVKLEQVYFSHFSIILTIFTQYILPIILWIGYLIHLKTKRREKDEKN